MLKVKGSLDDHFGNRDDKNTEINLRVRQIGYRGNRQDNFNWDAHPIKRRIQLREKESTHHCPSGSMPVLCSCLKLLLLGNPKGSKWLPYMKIIVN